MIPLLCQFAIVFAALPAQHKPLTQQQEDRILEMLGGDDTFLDEEFAKHGGFSPAAFPLYCRILDQSEGGGYLVSRTLYALTKSKGNRSQFVDRAVIKLAYDHKSVRRTAVELLAQIGSSRDAAPIVAMLSEKDRSLPFAAAKALAAIGDQRTLIAIDVWLNTEIHKNDTELREHVAQCRDQLRKRLEQEKRDKDKPPGK